MLHCILVRWKSISIFYKWGQKNIQTWSHLKTLLKITKLVRYYIHVYIDVKWFMPAYYMFMFFYYPVSCFYVVVYLLIGYKIGCPDVTVCVMTYDCYYKIYKSYTWWVKLCHKLYSMSIIENWNKKFNKIKK